MNAVMRIENLTDLIIEIRDERVLLDADVAQIYGVETRDINKAVANNPDKFPSGYVVELSKPEKEELVEKFHRFSKLKHSTVNPKAFTKKRLVHDGNHSEKSTSHRSHLCDHRDILKNQRTFPQYQRAIRSARQSPAKIADAKEWRTHN
jgi:hypothetical protein